MKLISIKTGKLPKERQWVIFRLEPENINEAPTYVCGYLRYSSSGKDFFLVIPGYMERHREITHWIDGIKPDFDKFMKDFENETLEKN